MAAELEKRASHRGDDTARESIWAALAPHANLLRARRGQNIAVAGEGEEAVFLLRSGALLLHLTMPGTQRQVTDLLLPGDVLQSGSLPPLAGATLTAAVPSETWRLRASTVDQLAAADASLRTFFRNAAAIRSARTAIHLAAIGRFDGQQRAATVLIDLALRAGRASSPPGALVLDMPFSRTDIADYLGLNPDTLSRITSRLRTAGIVGPSERSRVILRDVRKLAALSPASRSLAALCRSQNGGEAPARS